MDHFLSFLSFYFNDTYEIAPNLDDANSFMTPQVPSNQPFKTSRQSTKYQDMDFTHKYNNFFAQAFASHVDDPTSIVVALSTPNATQWQVALDAKYQSLISNNT
jgi:hypothetical protein